MAIAGHLTDEMRIHYSTISETEMRDTLSNIIDLAGVREARRASGVFALRKVA